MLKLIKIEESKLFKIEFDMYVPFKIRVGHWDMSKEHTIYWRTGDLKKSLFEIGFGSETGIVRSLTLTSIDIVERFNCVDCVKCETTEGTPSFDIKNFPKNGIKDFANQINVYLGFTEILVSINTSACIKRIKQGRIEYWFDSNDNLTSVKITEITSEEMNMLKQGLQV